MAVPDVTPYDAVLLVSFGGPEKPEDVVPFLENVTRGRGIPRERLEQVGEHYYLFGGRSPINDLNRDFLDALRSDLAEHGIDLPVYWGNRNWDPYLSDAMAEMARDGVQRAACFLTSAYSSYSSCRQYREDLAGAAREDGPHLDRLRQYFNHPGFLEPFVDGVVEALDGLPEGSRLVFVTHSIPTAMNDVSGGGDGGYYVRQHLDAAAYVARRVGEETGTDQSEHDLVYCSRSGAPHIPWLEPDVNDHLTDLSTRGVPGVVLVPIGFVSDHMEVVYDLDTEAMETARELDLPMVRVPTPGSDPRFVGVVRDLLLERAAAERGEQPERCTIGALGPRPDLCPVGCCANPRGERPTIGGQE